MDKRSEIEAAITEALPLLFKDSPNNRETEFEQKYTQAYQLFIEDSNTPISDSTTRYQQLLIKFSAIFFVITLFNLGDFSIEGIKINPTNSALAGYVAFLMILTAMFIFKAYIDTKRRSLVQNRLYMILTYLGNEMVYESHKWKLQFIYLDKFKKAIHTAYYNNPAYIAALLDSGCSPSPSMMAPVFETTITDLPKLEKLVDEQRRLENLFIDFENKLSQDTALLAKKISQLPSPNFEIPIKSEIDFGRHLLLTNLRDETLLSWVNAKDNLSRQLRDRVRIPEIYSLFTAHSAGLEQMIKKTLLLRKLHLTFEIIVPISLVCAVILYWRFSK